MLCPGARSRIAIANHGHTREERWKKGNDGYYDGNYEYRRRRQQDHRRHQPQHSNEKQETRPEAADAYHRFPLVFNDTRSALTLVDEPAPCLALAVAKDDAYAVGNSRYDLALAIAERVHDAVVGCTFRRSPPYVSLLIAQADVFTKPEAMHLYFRVLLLETEEAARCTRVSTMLLVDHTSLFSRHVDFSHRLESLVRTLAVPKVFSLCN